MRKPNWPLYAVRFRQDSRQTAVPGIALSEDNGDWTVGVEPMDCVACGGAAISERPERTAQGYRRFRCRDRGKQFNERSSGLLNRTQYSSDVIALVVFWRLRYKLSLRDLAEMLLLRGIEFSYEAVRAWEAKLAPLLIDNLRRRRGGGGQVRRSWYTDETCLLVAGFRLCRSGEDVNDQLRTLDRLVGVMVP